MKSLLVLLLSGLSFSAISQMVDSKFPNSSITMPVSGTIQGSSVTAAPATTGAMTITMTNDRTAFTITPSGACTFNAVGGMAGNRVTFIITTSGTSSFVMTWGTNFKTTSTLATGTTTAKTFCVTFICKDNITWCETGRTVAM
jgi:hypothetical protein